MTTAMQNIQTLIDEVTFAYSVERVAGFQLSELISDNPNIRVKSGLLLEAEENQRQCERLEGLIELLKPIGEKELADEECLKCFQQSLQLFNCFLKKHHTVGYDTSMLVAEVTGRTDILSTLQFCMKKETRCCGSSI
jgi:hypothetical protein